MAAAGYQALSVETLAQRLGGIAAIRDRVGPAATWRVREVGDGNLNLVFIVEGAAGAAIVKQALPYVRLVGESWPLPLKRAFFEYHALTRQARRDPGSVPQIHHFDADQALIVMAFLTPHVILRQDLVAGRVQAGIGQRLGEFCARTLFRGSDLAMTAADRKGDLALFAGNVELCDITENLVFSDPYFDAPLNRFTPALAPLVARLRQDSALKIAACELKLAFASRAETLLHGDLHTGSVMVTPGDLRVIDPEFATYGPMGFDVGMLISNFLMAYLSQPGHAETPGARDGAQDRILGVVSDLWASFVHEFTHLWRTERNGILFPRALFEDQGQASGAERALAGRLGAVWRDALGFCGIEMHRRILGLAHNADFERIADDARRAVCEARALELGRALMTGAGGIADMRALLDIARHFNTEDAL